MWEQSDAIINVMGHRMEFSEQNEKMPVIESTILSRERRGEDRRGDPNNTSVVACCLAHPDPQRNEPAIMTMFTFQQLLQLRYVS